MSRLFNGTSDQVQWSIGGCDLQTGWTMVAVIKLDAGVVWQAYLSNDNALNSSLVAMGRQGSSGNLASYTGGGANTQAAIPHSSADGWMLVATRRAAGNGQIPRLSKYPIGGSPTHTDAGGVQDNNASQSRVVFGQINNSDFFKGRLAVAAEWNTPLTDSQINSLVTTFTRANWLSLSPAGLWDELDAFATDHTGNGAARTSLVGTADDADDPAGWTGWAAAGDFAPSNTVAPAITGTPTAPSTISCGTGTWAASPTPTYTYQWKRNTVAISGETSSSYMLQPVDVGQSIMCTVTATNTEGSASANSNAVTAADEDDVFVMATGSWAAADRVARVGTDWL